ncbi:MAG TPA: heme lyase CcmF/NrfE family subunit, partial [Solirubrobacterales bacterium]|nr:heme lyase CcmF/NrfE family subunit [Solirubrobacterales bacterium]
IVTMWAALLTDSFELRNVAEYSSTTLQPGYKLTALWGSQAGSLLLWAWILSGFASLVVWVNRHRNRELMPIVMAVMMGIGIFFLALLSFVTSPFETLAQAPAEGRGLNPLLQNFYMQIHPPMLYLGYVGLSVPFAFAIAALVTRKLDTGWIGSIRRWTIFSWLFLGIGILLGAKWAYETLGWGGYWAWDPVENAALMPWLTGTAFLHSIMVQEKRGMLKVWNAALIVATFSLALLGTFLVRSGVLQSIHAFGDSTVGPYVLGLIAVVLIGSTALIVSRLDDLRTPKRIDSLASRESVFLVNNLLLVALTATIFWGTFFPLIAELFTGEKASLAAPWFDRYTTPLAILLVLFTGIGPLLAWRRITWASAKRVFLAPAAVALATGVVLVLFTDAAESLWALALFVFAAFALTGLAQEFWRGAAARRSLAGGSLPAALLAVTSRNRRRYGGYLVHVGVAVLLIGIAASSSFQTNRDLTLRPGESAVVGDRTFTYERPTVRTEPEALTFGAVLTVQQDDELVATLRPSRRYFRPSGSEGGTIGSYFDGEATSEVGLKAGFAHDLWSAVQPDVSALRQRAAASDRGFRACVRGGPGAPPQCRSLSRLMRAAAAQPRLRPVALAQIEALQAAIAERLARSYLADRDAATFRVIVDPLVAWVWIGGLIALAGALIAIWPARRARRMPSGDGELEALKEAKYREISDAELDHAAGKLSDEDFALLDAELRREAVEVLDRVENGGAAKGAANGNGAGKTPPKVGQG